MVFFNCSSMCSSLKPVVVFLDTIHAEKFTLPRKQEGEHKKASSFCLILTKPAIMNDKTGAPTCPLISISAYLFSRARTISTWPPLTAPISIVSPLWKHEKNNTQEKQNETWPVFNSSCVLQHFSLSKQKSCSTAPRWPHPVRNIDITARVKKVLHNLNVTLLGCDSQSRVPVFVRHVDVRIPL